MGSRGDGTVGPIGHLFSCLGGQPASGIRGEQGQERFTRRGFGYRRHPRECRAGQNSPQFGDICQNLK
jgi:hypothetical protein